MILALVAAAGVFFGGADRFNRRDRRVAARICLIAAAILGVVALVIGWTWPHNLGIDPTRHSYGAAVWTYEGGMSDVWNALPLFCRGS